MSAKPTECQRVFSRIPFCADVELHLPDLTLQVNLVDIALKGALIRTSSPADVRLQTPCRLVLPLSDAGEAIEMEGRIAHLKDLHVGIACEHIDLFSLTQLRRLLELNTGDADLMDRELSHLFASKPN